MLKLPLVSMAVLCAMLQLSMACCSLTTLPETASNEATQTTTKLFHDEGLGIEFEYPASWVETAMPSPYVSCSGCITLGLAGAAHPYGVQLFTESLDKGCGATCYVGNRALPRGEERSLVVAGRDATQVEIERQAPLGLVSQTGDDTPYSEVWTLIPMNDRALFVVAFYRFGDTAAEVEIESAYNDMLASLVFLP